MTAQAAACSASAIHHTFAIYALSVCMFLVRGHHDSTTATSQVAKKTVEACRSYLELPHFNKEVIYNKSRAAAGLCEWAINIVKYYDVVSEVEPKRQELAAANTKLQEANTLLVAVQQKARLHSCSDQHYLGSMPRCHTHPM